MKTICLVLLLLVAKSFPYDYFPLTVGNWWLYKKIVSKFTGMNPPTWRDEISYEYYEILKKDSVSHLGQNIDSVCSVIFLSFPDSINPDTIQESSEFDTFNLAIQGRYIWRLSDSGEVTSFCGTTNYNPSGGLPDWPGWPVMHDLDTVWDCSMQYPCHFIVPACPDSFWHVCNYLWLYDDSILEFSCNYVSGMYYEAEYKNNIGMISLWMPSQFETMRWTIEKTSLRGDKMEAQKADYLIANIKLRAFPNPFNQTCGVTFTLPLRHGAGPSTFCIYSVTGRLVFSRTLPAGAGPRKIVWNGGGLPGGIYLARLKDGKSITSKTIVMLP